MPSRISRRSRLHGSITSIGPTARFAIASHVASALIAASMICSAMSPLLTSSAAAIACSFAAVRCGMRSVLLHGFRFESLYLLCFSIFAFSAFGKTWAPFDVYSENVSMSR